LSYNEKNTLANNQLINTNTGEIKNQTQKFYDNIMIKYVSKVVVEVVTLVISTMLNIFLAHSGIYRVKDVKKPYESSYDIFIF